MVRVGLDAVEVGYWIHVHDIRNGYATEAAEGSFRRFFDRPGVIQGG